MRRPLQLLSLSLAVATAVACGSDSTTEVVDLPTGYEGSTIDILVRNPAIFQSEIQDSRAGWVAFHNGNLAEAVSLDGEEFSNPKGRAAAELAALHFRLAQVQSEALISLAESQENIGRATALPLFAHIAQLEMTDSGFTSTGDSTWLSASIESTLPEVAEAATLLSAQGLEESGQMNPFTARYLRHQRERTAGQTDSNPDAQADVVVAPLWELESIRLYDPQTHFTLAHIYQMEAERLRSSGLSAALFSPCPNSETASGASRESQALRLGAPCADQLTHIGVDTELITAMIDGEDDLQSARTLVHRVDEILDEWSNAAAHTASPDGVALLTSLSLVESFRAKLLVSLAGDLLNQGRPHQALAVAQATLDITNPRSVSVTNPALLFAVLAHAQLRTGHTREALDALEVLSQIFPSVITVDETVGDLAVVEGLHRLGDSKEL
jgi:hypothetical protein